MKNIRKDIPVRQYRSLEVCDSQASAGTEPRWAGMLLSPKGSELDRRGRARWGNRGPEVSGSISWRIRNDCMKKRALELVF